MSVEQAKSFIEKLNSDEAFLNQVAAAGDNESLLGVAREAGYDFSLEELQQSMPTQTEEELSDDELEAVAGGAMQIFVKTWKLEPPTSQVKYGDIT